MYRDLVTFYCACTMETSIHSLCLSHTTTVFVLGKGNRVLIHPTLSFFFHLLNWEVIVGRCIHVKLHVYSPSAQFVIISRSSVCLSKVCSAESAASTELSHDCDINMVLKTCVSSCPFVSSSSKAMFLKWGYVYHQGYPEVLQRVL